MKFAADCMLGTLAKWLRILGHDVAYFRHIDDADLVALAASEGRTLLTCDRRLVHRRAARDHILVRSQVLREQIEQVLGERGLAVRGDELLGRCLRCNTANEVVPREAVRDLVPTYVYRTQSRFTRCPTCARIYWRATHVTRMLERLSDATGTKRAGRPGGGQERAVRGGGAPKRGATRPQRAAGLADGARGGRRRISRP